MRNISVTGVVRPVTNATFDHDIRTLKQHTIIDIRLVILSLLQSIFMLLQNKTYALSYYYHYYPLTL